MDRKTTIKDQLVSPAIESGDLALIEKTVSIWKTAVEADRAEQDILYWPAKERTEKVRFWVPILVPVLSAIALIATLVIQMRQYQENEQHNQENIKLAAQTAEDNAWREVIKGAQANGREGLFSLSLMKPFLDSPRYQKPAREISISLLGRMADPDAFNILFPEILRRTSWENFNDITKLNSYLFRQSSEAFNEAKKQTAPGVLGSQRDPQDVRNDFNEELGTTQDATIAFMKSHGAEPARANSKLSFNYNVFGSVDLSNLDFSGSTLRGTRFYRCVVKGVNFSGIADYNETDWPETAWWRAGKMDVGLLDYLEKFWAFKPSNKYPGDQTEDTATYQSEVARLRAITRNQ